MSDIEQQINARIESFIADINELAKRAAMETLKDALDQGMSAGPTRRSVTTTGDTRRRKGGKRSPEQIALIAESLYQHIEQNPGQRMEDIAKAMNSTSKDLTLPLKKLQADGRITVKGQKRATSYYAAGSKTSSKASKPRTRKTRRSRTKKSR